MVVKKNEGDVFSSLDPWWVAVIVVTFASAIILLTSVILSVIVSPSSSIQIVPIFVTTAVVVMGYRLYAYIGQARKRPEESRARYEKEFVTKFSELLASLEANENKPQDSPNTLPSEV